MSTHDPLQPVGDVLVTLATGLWHWDTEAGAVRLDAEAARLMGLPARPVTLTEAGARARFHPVDWNEIEGVVRLAVAENTLTEVRLRVMDEEGRVLRSVRSRSKPRKDPETGHYLLIGTLQEISDAVPGGTDRAPVIGDWRRAREAFLLDAGRALAEARSTEEVLRVAANLSMPGFTPDGLAVFGAEADRLTIIGHHGHSEGDENPFTAMPVDTDYPAADVVRTGRAVYLASPAEYRRRYPVTWPLAEPFGRESWAFLPLIVAGRTIGAWMAAFSYRVSFTPDERSVLTTVARMLAGALTRANTAETERELTEGLQRAMLPRLGPQVPELQVAARYVPTGGGLQVGGDWFDMIALPTGRIALVVGDVQGHDVRAAGLMGQLRIALRAYASEGHRPDAVLARASRFLYGITNSVAHGRGPQQESDPEPRFATCLYVEAEPGTGVLEIARAGHPDPAIRMDDGTVVLRPTAGGLPLGIDPDADYPTTQLALEPGETMLLCTDGLIETGGHDLDSGWARIRTIMEEHSGERLEGLAEALVQAVHGPPSHYTTGPLADRREDDIAMLLVRRNKRPQQLTPDRRFALTLAQAEPERVAAARQQVREVLHDWSDPEQVDSAVLLVSEMLTNVLVHTDGDALLVVVVSGERGRRRLRVSAGDGSDDLPHLRRPGELASSGRGLVLMDVLADAWGVDPQGDGKSIWFELNEAGRAGHHGGAEADGGPVAFRGPVRDSVQDSVQDAARDAVRDPVQDAVRDPVQDPSDGGGLAEAPEGPSAPSAPPSPASRARDAATASE
ncbi:SpoIIE family protein phosphatase [Streptomyces sp. NA04227]|uniref:ATP-binding SpoIIE family protein phosphatase n=1 Tax=Streptomyces sp. NA04227 TaxID=2742136 RepID=UPI0015905DC9|nr:SpoIIE family protein phosphatase [Streptomyces sp. NA04227]QKW07678.1 SpoIIE family protein phosphatase [Streptomyces sp. NA04227]